MVEYAILVAHIGLGALGSFAHSAEVWLSGVNWTVVGWVVLILIAIRFVTWALRP
jgi:hypothetical protein